MKYIKTFCEQCRAIYADSFTLKPISGRTTTPKVDYCENCKRKFSSPYDLKQYLVSGKGGRK